MIVTAHAFRKGIENLHILLDKPVVFVPINIIE